MRSALFILVATATIAAAEPRWITTPDQGSNAPCPLIRKTVTVVDSRTTPIQSAKIQVVGLGHYQIEINGAIVGDSVINQPWSQYDKRIYRQTFDIRKLLHSGENEIRVQMGNSFWWVEQPAAAKRFVKTDAMPNFAKGQRYLLHIEGGVQYERSRIPIETDESWEWAPSQLTFSNIYAGEDFDASRQVESWNTCEIARSPEAAISDLASPPVKTFEVFGPTEIRRPEPGVFTYIFPQNCSALLRFTVDGPAKSTVRFKPCEYMDDAGKIKFTYLWGTGKDIWQDYTLRGNGPESHQTIFCYDGCRYVEVTGAVPDGDPNPSNLPVIRKLELVHVRAACPAIGSFECDNEIQNKAHALIDWSIKSNMNHVLTDCPHREKNGWQEQNWHMARSMCYSYDMHEYLKKVLQDVRDTQLPDGHIPTNCPNYLVGIPPHGYWNEATEWGASGVLVPWHLYEWYGDREILATSFASMKAYVDYLASIAKDGVVTSNLGDWYDYGHGKGDGPSQWTPREVSGTLMWVYCAKTVAETARVLGKEEDAAKYRAEFEKISEGFRAKFWDRQTHTVKNGGSCQSGTSFALCIGIVPESERAAAVDAIVKDLETRGYQQTCGEVLHVFLVRALSDAGRGNVLHKVYSREDRGSYGFMVKSGLTTLPENWDAKSGTGNSMNHLMNGHLMEWHFANVCGIQQDPNSVGWKHVRIVPQIGELKHAKGSFVAPPGKIEVEWTRVGDSIEMRVDLPSGVTGEAVMPDGTTSMLIAGRNSLKSQAK